MAKELVLISHGKMAEGVKDVIDDCNSTMQSVLSGGSAPAMA